MYVCVCVYIYIYRSWSNLPGWPGLPSVHYLGFAGVCSSQLPLAQPLHFRPHLPILCVFFFCLVCLLVSVASCPSVTLPSASPNTVCGCVGVCGCVWLWVCGCIGVCVWVCLAQPLHFRPDLLILCGCGCGWVGGCGWVSGCVGVCGRVWVCTRKTALTLVFVCVCVYVTKKKDLG